MQTRSLFYPNSFDINISIIVIINTGEHERPTETLFSDRAAR